jgi:hypothetical protein
MAGKALASCKDLPAASSINKQHRGALNATAAAMQAAVVQLGRFPRWQQASWHDACLVCMLIHSQHPQGLCCCARRGPCTHIMYRSTPAALHHRIAHTRASSQQAGGGSTHLRRTQLLDLPLPLLRAGPVPRRPPAARGGAAHLCVVDAALRGVVQALGALHVAPHVDVAVGRPEGGGRRGGLGPPVLQPLWRLRACRAGE